jgi:hypothetical protein
MSTLYVNTINPKTGTGVKLGGSISGSSNIAIGGNIEFSGSLIGAGHVSSSGDVYANGSISGSNNLAIGGNIEFSGSLIGAGHVSSSGDVYANGSISGSNNLAIGGNIHASGTITCDALNVNEINSTSKTVNTLEIVDKVIMAASGTYPNNSNGAGLQIGGHSTGSAGTDIAATFFYNSTKNSMDLSTTMSSSGDALILGSISGSNNLAVGGNMHLTGALTTAGIVTANAGVKVDNITIDGTEIDLSSGDLTLDVAGDIILDADGADILFKDAGAIFGGISHNGGIGSGTQDLIISASYQNGDIIFSGSDAGSAITALTLDMSDAGHAKFNSHVSASGDVYALGSISGSNNLSLGGNIETSGSVRIGTGYNGGSTNISVRANSAATSSIDLFEESGGSSTGFGTAWAYGFRIMYDGTNNKLYFKSGQTTTTADRMVIVRNTGKVGIGTDVPSELLTVIGNVSSSGDVYALGSISGSNNLAVGGNLHISGSMDLGGDVDIDGTTNLDNTDIDGTFTMDGTAFDVNATTTCAVDNTNTSNGVTINTATSGGPISIGHSTSETTVNDNLTVTGDLAVNGDTTTLASANTTDPLLVIKNTTNDGYGSRLRFIKDKGAAGAANDEAGVIEFYADDANQDNICFASVTGSVAVHTNGQEGGKLTLKVASHDGEQQPGLVIADGDAEDEVDVTLGNGDASLTTVAGSLAVTSDTTLGNAAGDRTHVTGSFFIKNATYDYYPVNYSHNTDALQLNGVTYINYQTTASMGMEIKGSNTLISGSGGYVDLRGGIGNVSFSGSLAMPGFSLSTNDAGTSNTVFGKLAGNAIASGGNYNLLMGENAGNDLTTGDDNVIIGYNTAVVATTTSDLVVVGSGAGIALAAGNTDPDGTVLIGKAAGAALTAGRYNVAIGHDALKLLEDGDANTAIGFNALDAFNSSAGGNTSNTAIGCAALSAANSATAKYNTAVGGFALESSTTGQGNTAVGASALNAATLGTSVGYEEYTFNTALGAFAGLALTTGISNIFIGAGAGQTSVLPSKCVIISQQGLEGANPGIMTAAADGTVAIGYASCHALTSGEGNVAVGFEALKSNVDGDKNTAVGYQALKVMEPNDGDSLNTALGYKAGVALTTGENNVIIGGAAGCGATTMANAVLIGKGAGCGDPGSANAIDSDTQSVIAIGRSALGALTTGPRNIAIGDAAMIALVSGGYNIAIGDSALSNLAATSDYGENVAIGYVAGSRVNGAGSSTDGVKNTLVGHRAGEALELGQNNTFIGWSAGQSDRDSAGNRLDGDGSTCVGASAGKAMITTAHSNTFVGYAAGDVATTAVENTCLGFNCDIYDATATNQIVIGNNLTGTDLDNSVYIGNDSSHIQNDFNADATWSHSSDMRQKTDIQDDTLGLDFISNLRTVTYSHKSPSEFPKEWTAYDPEDTTPMGEGKTIHGFIAQEVKEALDTAGCETFGGWSVDPDGRQRVSFEAFVMPLIRAVQELSTKVTELEAKLDKDGE